MDTPASAQPAQAAQAADLGELDRSADAWRVRFVRRLAHSPARVWRALTDPGELEAWFPTTIEGERAAGSALAFSYRHGEGEPFTGVMLACDPPRLLEFLWGSDRIRFELEPTDEGAQLTLWDYLDENGKAARDAAGWHVCLQGLLILLDGAQDGAARSPLNWADLIPLYREAFGAEASTIGPPAGHPAAE